MPALLPSLRGALRKHFSTSWKTATASENLVLSPKQRLAKREDWEPKPVRQRGGQSRTNRAAPFGRGKTSLCALLSDPTCFFDHRVGNWRRPLTAAAKQLRRASNSRAQRSLPRRPPGAAEACTHLPYAAACEGTDRLPDLTTVQALFSPSPPPPGAALLAAQIQPRPRLLTSAPQAARRSGKARRRLLTRPHTVTLADMSSSSRHPWAPPS
jgi:hypothetical protein